MILLRSILLNIAFYVNLVVWLTIALPLLGFLINGGLALRKPDAKGLVAIVGSGVLIAAFGVAVAIFAQLRAHPP